MYTLASLASHLNGFFRELLWARAATMRTRFSKRSLPESVSSSLRPRFRAVSKHRNEISQRFGSPTFHTSATIGAHQRLLIICGARAFGRLWLREILR